MDLKIFDLREFGYVSPPNSNGWWGWVNGEEPNFSKEFALHCWRQLLPVFNEFRGEDAPLREEWVRARHIARLAMQSVKNPSEYAIEPRVFQLTKGDSKRVVQAYVAYIFLCFDKGILALRDRDASKAAEFFMYAKGGIDTVMGYKRSIESQKGSTSKVERQHNEVSSKGGKAKRDKSPAAPEIVLIKECWLRWQKDPSIYKSKAAFARDMLDKCDYLVSAEGICKRCREWEKEKQRFFR